jgi:pimeloyl-ACP methyl ester carboxylesterase
MSKLHKKLALVAATGLVAFGVSAIPAAAHAAAPQCATANYVQTCGGATSDGAPYAMMVPANFNGTVFIYSHGYRYNVDIPAQIPLIGGYSVKKVLSTPQPAPLPGNTDTTVIKALLGQGFAVMGSAFSTEGWNAGAAVATDVELINAFKTQFPTTKKVIAWGESLGGFITQALAESHPELIDAAGLMCPALGTVEAELTGAGDFLWGMKTFFDPSIRGHNYDAGPAGVQEAMGDLVKIFTVASKLQASMTTNAWPDTSGAAGTALAAIPPRSALLLVGLMAGIPTKSAHFDGTTGPGKTTDAAYTSFALAASPALAVLENGTQAAALAVLATLDLEQQTGGAFYDNTKTDYQARVGSDLYSFNAALSGNTAVTGMLSFLNAANPAAPRWSATAASVAKLRALTAHTGKITKPTIALAATSDPIVPAGNTQWLVEQYAPQLAAAKAAAAKQAISTGKLVKAQQLFLPLWNNAPASYTKFDSAGSPITSTPGVTGTGHCNFTATQYIYMANMLAGATVTGNVNPTAALRKMARKAGGTIDPAYVAPQLKFYQN